MQRTRPSHTLAWAFLICLLLTLGLAVTLPSRTLSWLRHDYVSFGQLINWLDRLSPGFDLIHVLLFCGIGVVLHWVRPTMPWWRFVAWMVGLAVATEVLQFLVPGREPRLSDVRDDLVGAAIGLGIAIAIGLRTDRRQGLPGRP